MIKKALHPPFLPAFPPYAETFRMNQKRGDSTRHVLEHMTAMRKEYVPRLWLYDGLWPLYKARQLPRSVPISSEFILRKTHRPPADGSGRSYIPRNEQRHVLTLYPPPKQALDVSGVCSHRLIMRPPGVIDCVSKCSQILAGPSRCAGLKCDKPI
jgi:hypothetical protein